MPRTIGRGTRFLSISVTSAIRSQRGRRGECPDCLAPYPRSSAANIFSSRTETKPVDKHVIGTGGHEEDGFGDVRGAEHAGPGNEALAVVRIHRIPHRGIGWA